MNILVVLESYYPNVGGVEQHFTLICEGFVRQGHAVTVLTTGVKSHPVETSVNGVTITRLRTKSRYWFTLFSLPALLCMASNCDLILTTSYNAAFPTWICARWHRKKVIVVIHEVWGELWFQLPFLGWIRKATHYGFEQLLLGLSFDRFVVPSNATETRLIEHGVDPERIVRIYNGLAYHQFSVYRHIPPGTFTYCYFGRLGISKGLDILLPAAACFAEQNPQSRLNLIIPARPIGQYKKIITLISQYGLEQHVHIQHNLPKEALYDSITSSHCVIFPSYSEGFCFAAVESIALGVPVIVSDRGALPEVVSRKHLVVTELTSDAFCDALTQAINEAWKSTELKVFSVEDTIRGYLELFDEVL